MVPGQGLWIQGMEIPKNGFVAFAAEDDDPRAGQYGGVGVPGRRRSARYLIFLFFTKLRSICWYSRSGCRCRLNICSRSFCRRNSVPNLHIYAENYDRHLPQSRGMAPSGTWRHAFDQRGRPLPFSLLVILA